MKFLSHLQHEKNKNERGFSLIEIIVSLGIFSIVAVVALGAFLKIIDANKKSQTLKTAINNLNFTLETMSREMRVGTQYYCGSSDPTVSTNPNQPNNIGAECGGNRYIAFRSSEKGSVGNCNLVYAYRFNNNENDDNYQTIEKATQQNCDDDIEDDEYVPITSNDMRISNVEFRVEGIGEMR